MAETYEFDWTQIDWNDLYPRLLLVAEGKLTRISQTVECIGGANQRKLLCHNDFPLIPEAPDADRVYAESV
jgi:hypothetical protein